MGKRITLRWLSCIKRMKNGKLVKKCIWVRLRVQIGKIGHLRWTDSVGEHTSERGIGRGWRAQKSKHVELGWGKVEALLLESSLLGELVGNEAADIIGRLNVNLKFFLCRAQKSISGEHREHHWFHISLTIDIKIICPGSFGRRKCLVIRL